MQKLGQLAGLSTSREVSWPDVRCASQPAQVTSSVVPPSISSVSSPNSRDADDEHDVDVLLDGIERVRIDDLWSTPRSARSTCTDSGASNQAVASCSPGKQHQDTMMQSSGELGQERFRVGLFTPFGDSGMGAIASSSDTVKSSGFAGARSVVPRGLSHVGCPGDRESSNVQNFESSRSISGFSETWRKTCDIRPSHCVSTPRASTSTLDFPRLFKVLPCDPHRNCAVQAEQSECFFYHSNFDRRRPDFSLYKPHMCRFVEEIGGCRKGDRCPFSHNDFERRYHPDRFGKETCRDFLRGDCPRRYCTFKHEVSGKVELAITQIESMSDKELLQLVLKLSDSKGRALSEKLLRRFGHGKKHSGWRLQGFSPQGRDDQKVKFVASRVEVLKKVLRSAGEKKWATSLKTSSLRDMMSGIRKVAEEIRERHRDEPARGDSGGEIHRLIRSVFSSTNWSCHSQEGDNPFVVTPENQNDAVSALERLVHVLVSNAKSISQGSHPAFPEVAFGISGSSSSFSVQAKTPHDVFMSRGVDSSCQISISDARPNYGHRAEIGSLSFRPQSHLGMEALSCQATPPLMYTKGSSWDVRSADILDTKSHIAGAERELLLGKGHGTS